MMFVISNEWPANSDELHHYSEAAVREACGKYLL